MRALFSFLFFIVPLFIVRGQVSPPAAYGAVPSEKQLAWHEMEKYAFVHFTTNTFTGKEWGYGDENPQIVNPTQMNVDQWVKTIKEAGLNGLVLTCKHHDGFCLWPSQFTDHSIKYSPYKNGKGDIVKEVSDACHKYGIKFGIYLSPWDRNRSDYGSASYVEYYRNQLNELFTNYGPVFEMWFDGANGGDGFYGGAKEKRKINGASYYDWPKTIEMVKKLEPNIVFFSDGGPDIRWCGNEEGSAGETNWATLSNDTIFAGKSNITEALNNGQEDGKHWVPSEVDVSIRPGWFYHAEEDSKVKSPEKLFEIYLNSVGRGSNLILNIPPDRRGLLHENDVNSLLGWKKLMDESFKTNLAASATIKASSFRGSARQFRPENVLDNTNNSYWATDDQVKTGSLEINFPKKQKINFVMLQEYIKLGQRVKSFTIEGWVDNSWKKIAGGTTIGYKRILKIQGVETTKIKVTITESKACPVISTIKVF